MTEKLVWYACYGSNLLKERFMCYIQGGICRFNGAKYEPCSDKSEPRADKPIIINYKLYFANSAPKWKYCGVAFLNPVVDNNQKTLGRMYLITERQFKEIQAKEGGWYRYTLHLGNDDGIEIFTFTNIKVFEENAPSDIYQHVMFAGLRETYPEMEAERIIKYINEHI